jgi:hypothetical protein
MTKEKRLKKEAMDAAKWRGHLFHGKWLVNDYVSYKNFIRICTLCGKQVYINTKPAPNEIDISGQAVAVGCYGIHDGGDS